MQLAPRPKEPDLAPTGNPAVDVARANGAPHSRRYSPSSIQSMQVSFGESGANIDVTEL